jgi:putative salt-induced outer membrane protein YdiY
MIAATSALALSLAAAAPAAPPAEPAGTVGAGTPATTGATEIEGAGKFATATLADEENLDATELQVAAGGILNTGNSRSLAATAAANFRVRRDVHQFTTAFAGNYAQAALDNTSPIRTTVGNAQGRVRYDFFFAKRWSVFGMVTARHDPFQGLTLRLNVDPGVAFYAIQKATHRLWFEAGYDYQYDYRTDAGRVVVDELGVPTGEILEVDRHGHAARLFGGYSNHLSEAVKFDTGLEYLQSFLVARRWRVNWDISLTASIATRFALATTFVMRVDNDPLPGIKKIDTVTALSLLVTIL